ncbi:hypothetical protein Tco_0940744 [Tanacetum coccineum]|uniref:Uncharacterized protein n=1 Tax=Tanacetum coccineum TaxID=301880 RepID=A0ABQ5DPC3_9ASTR
MLRDSPCDIVETVSTAVRFGNSGEFFVAGTAGIVTIVGWYGPSKMHFLKASPFGHVSMYLKNVIAIVHIVLLQALVDDPLNQLPLCCYAFDCRLWKLQLELS